MKVGVNNLPGLLELESLYGNDHIVVPPGSTAVMKPDIGSKLKDWEQFRSTVLKCTKCDLHKGRKNVVFGEGNVRSPIMFIGEGPGEDEDKSGRPFVGRAGRVLREVISEFIDCKEVYIANIVKCRPPMNRLPSKTEISKCFPYLLRQLNFIKPKVICCLGSTATMTILGRQQVSMSRMRGQAVNFMYGTVFICYHPSYLLRRGLVDLPMFKDDIKKALKLSGVV